MNQKEFCVALACAVTESSACKDHNLIAKNRCESLFAFVQKISPWVSPAKHCEICMSKTSTLSELPEADTRPQCTFYMSLMKNVALIFKVCHFEPRRRRRQGKMARAEFNKLLEARCEFESVRVRKMTTLRLLLVSL